MGAHQRLSLVLSLCFFGGCETQTLSFGGQPSEVVFASPSPKSLPSYIGSSLRPAEGEAHGFVIGSLGSAGNDQHLLWRRLTIHGNDKYEGPANSALVLFASGMYAGAHSSAVQTTASVLSDAAPARSSTFILKLRPGEYRLAGIRIERRGHTGPTLLGAHPNWKTWALMSVPFTVSAGRAVYLGELLSAVGTLEGERIVYFLAADRLERDLSLVGQYTTEVQPLQVDNAARKIAAGARPTASTTVLQR